MVDISIYKRKYRNPDSRILHRDDVERLLGLPYGATRTYNGGRFGAKPRTNSAKASKGQVLRPRKKAYGPF